MMAMTMHVNIVSAENEIYSDTVIECYAPAEMGELGIHPRHTPLITKLKPGDVRVLTQSGEMIHFYVSGGILEIQPHVVTILSDTAMRAADLDEAAALEAKTKAEDAMKNHDSEMDFARAKAELAEAAAMIESIRKARKK